MTALDQNGNLVVLLPSMEKDMLRKSRTTSLFYCPQCENPVQLKVGDIVIPHFAHLHDTSCSNAFSEGESFEHLLGKQHLFTFLQKHAERVELEPFVERISQRPDLLVTLDSKQIAIEFQCSPISALRMNDRTAGYQRAGIAPFWLLHTPDKSRQQPQGIGIFQFSRFQEQFFTSHPPEGSMLITYHPQSDCFHYFSSLLHIAGRRYIGNHRKLPSCRQSVPLARPKVPTEEEIQYYYVLYQTARSTFLKTSIWRNRKGLRDPFLRKCYEMRIIPSELPTWIGVPTRNSEAFREHDCEWQAAFIYFARKRELQIDQLSKSHIKKFLNRYDGNRENLEKACLAYRDFLIKSHVDIRKNRDNLLESCLIKVLAGRFLAIPSEY
ncbi:competence protein CoiA family protein [Sporosarcina sp. 179-K 3D1 HS]|uniref:competence protein CoiA n=1 Tax=Sporosarcina sp. 179-K 3D1 HS TaxID=3232169 RepID=UPI0039A0371A